MFQTFISRHNSNFFSDSWFSLLLLQRLRHLYYRHLKLHRQRYILIVWRLMLVMGVFSIAFRWTLLATQLIGVVLSRQVRRLIPPQNLVPFLCPWRLLRFPPPA